jgi:alpha-beta hydrolase superfamily lysophospholipase
LGAVKIPVLLLGALNDSAITPAVIEATARACGAVAEIIANMAHDIMLKTSWKTVADRILRWLEEQGL